MGGTNITASIVFMYSSKMNITGMTEWRYWLTKYTSKFHSTATFNNIVIIISHMQASLHKQQ